MIYEVILFEILGLFVGSFLNVLILRLKSGEQFITGRSYCPNCRAVLKTFDLIPVVSFILLHGKCRSCRSAISWQYPTVELVTAFAFVSVFLLHAPLSLGIVSNVLFFRDIVFVCGAIVLFVLDYRWYIVPDQVTVFLTIFLFVLNVFLGFKLSILFLGVLVGAGFYFCLFALSKGRWVGAGDIYIGAVLGAMFGWPMILAVLYVAYLIGGVSATFLLVTGKKNKGGVLPMGTFLFIGALFVLFFQNKVAYFFSLLL